MTAETTTRTEPFTESSGLLGDPAALRSRLDEDGHLFFRGLLPRTEILDLRRAVLGVAERHGLVAPGTDPADAYPDLEAYERLRGEDREFCGSGVGRPAYLDLYRLEAFHRLAHHPRLLDLYGRLFGERVLPHPRNVGRITVPARDARPTPPHQDFIHVQGAVETLTAWIPLGDIPREQGPLTVLSGSNREGMLSYRAAEGPGGLEAYLCDLPYAWRSADYETGDVLTFHSHTVHRALPNVEGERLRLSVDYRYQRASDPIDPAALRTHCDVAPWETVYEGWTGTDLQYYWDRETLTLSEWDENLRWQRDRIC